MKHPTRPAHDSSHANQDEIAQREKQADNPEPKPKYNGKSENRVNPRMNSL